MTREQELKYLYSVITLTWETLKANDYRNMTEEKWDSVVGELEKNFHQILAVDKPMAILYEHTMFEVIDYLTPAKREKNYKKTFD